MEPIGRPAARLSEGGHAVVGVAVGAFERGVGDEADEPVFGGPAGEVGSAAEIALIAELVAIDARGAFKGFAETFAPLGERAVLLGFLVGVGLRSECGFG